MAKIYRIFLFFFIIFCVLNVSTAQKYSNNTVILKVKTTYKNHCKSSRINIPSIQKIFDVLEVTKARRLFPNSTPSGPKCTKCVDISTLYKLSYNKDIDPNKAAAIFEKMVEVEYAVPLYLDHILEVPNDPLNTTYQYYLDIIDAYEAYDYGRGDTNIVIGILDTGIDLDHEDLVDNIAYNFTDPINGLDDDNDGFTDNFRGWDLGENDNNPQVSIDPNVTVRNHGIHVAGVAGATTNNETGITGVGYRCKILPVKISDDRGALTHSYEGIVYAADQGCQIINLSWGNTYYSPYAEDVVKYATYNKKSLLIAAAGNEGNERLYYPASFDDVISVAGTDDTDKKWSGSTYNYQVNISAPGSGVYFTMLDNQYGYGWGTSFASPIIAGAAGIAAAHYPDYTMTQIGELLKVNSDVIDSIQENQVYANKLGAGRVNLRKTLTQPPKPSVKKEIIQIISDNEYYSPGSEVNIYMEFTNYFSQVSNSIIDLLDHSNYIDYNLNSFFIDTLKALETTSTTEPFSFEVADSMPLNHKVTFQLNTAENILLSNPYFDFIFNKTFLDISTPSIRTTITSNGRIGYWDVESQLGEGFVYRDLDNMLYQCGMLIGNSTYKTLGAVYDDDDWIPLNRPEIIDTLGNSVQAHSSYRDASGIEHGLGLSIDQKTYYNLSSDSSNFIIVEYTIQNLNKNSIEGLYMGLFADWDVINAAQNKASYDDNQKIIYTYSTGTENYYAGMHLITNQSVNYYNIDNIEGGNGGIDVTNGFSPEEKYFVLTNNRFEAGSNASGNDVINVISAGPFSILPGETAVLAFSLIVAENLYVLQTSATKANDMYESIHSSVKERYLFTDMEIYPTLAHPYEIITITHPENCRMIQIFDVQWKEIGSTPVNANAKITRFSLPGLYNGIYFIQLHQNGPESITKKILVTGY